MSVESLSAAPDHPRRTFSLLGQGEAERSFLSAWNGGRLPHAWLIEGPRGVGKATLAYRIARFALKSAGAGSGGLFGDDLPPVSLDIAADDPVSQRIAASGHADLLSVERTVNEKTGKMRRDISAEDARGLPGFFSMTSAEGGYRIAIVDALDEANVEGVNALLKIVEEPPARALILLLAHKPGRVLPTIRSRCRRLMLRPLPDEDVLALLQARHPDLSRADAAAVAALAEGSPGRAFRLVAAGGVDLHRQLAGLLGRLPQLDLPAVHALGDKLNRGGEEGQLPLLGELLSWWLTRIVRRIATGEALAPGEEAGVVEKLAQRGSLDRWVQLWEKTGRLVERADALNLERKQVVLTLFGDFARTAA